MIAVVTGANRGIGRATALALGAEGMSLALLVRTQKSAARVRNELALIGAECKVFVCDVSSPRDIERACKEVLRTMGTPRVVVNNAGIATRSPVHKLTERAWDETMATNLRGPFLVTRAFLPAMLRAKAGRIVQVASISSTLGTANMSAYCASKWGLLGFTKALAEELRGTRVQTMAVLPGSVDTDMLRGSGFSAAMTADDVAGTIAYAALYAPDAMNGSAIEVFG